MSKQPKDEGGMERQSSLYVEALHGFKDHTSAKMGSEG